MSLTIKATLRDDQGKGASRRLRRDEKVPAIVYGANKAPNAITLDMHEITHFLENDDAYTSVLDLTIDKKKEPVIIKDLQRHPAKNSITHVDFLRINLKQAIITSIPLHFVGEEDNDALRIGAILNQFVTNVEISCLPGDLPHGIDVDISSLSIGDSLSLTDLVMPEGVVLTALQHDDVEAYNQSVVAVQEARIMEEPEEDIVDSESTDADAQASDDADDTQDGEDNSDT